MSVGKILTFTVMKNEGPFILEWVAYQRLLGVDNILVFTNDCDDGTDLILDRLDDMGLVRHVPNPCALPQRFITGNSRPHILGINYAHLHRQWREADYIFLTDVDEFPVIRTGDGTLRALLKKTEYPDVISINEMLFGSDTHFTYADKLVTETFTRQDQLNPDRPRRARRGLKSITRNRPDVLRITNHRPLTDEATAADLHWVDGSGRPFPVGLRHIHEKGTDCRGSTDLAVINHYSLRWVESFLVKMARGDAVDPNRMNLKYFQHRNKIAEENLDIMPRLPGLKAELAELKKDARLAELHAQAVDVHRAKIKQLSKGPFFAELMAQLGFQAEQVA